MRLPFVVFILAWVAVSAVFCERESVLLLPSTISAASPPAANQSHSESTSLLPPEIAVVAKRIHTTQPPLLEHAPLALFSLGSLAVGGVFFAIHQSSQNQNPTFTGGERFTAANAMVAAGLTAALAAGSYVYFTRESAVKAREWDTEVSGGISPEGEAGISALIILPLSYLTR